MRSGWVALGGWLVLAGACERPLGAGGGTAPGRDASPYAVTDGGAGGPASAPDASPRLDGGAGAPGRDSGVTAARDAGDPSIVAATTGAIVEPALSSPNHDTCASRTPNGWCWVEPRPQGNILRDLSSALAGQLWAVGDAGTALHGLAQVNGQAAWTLVDVGLTADLTAVSTTADGAIFVGSAIGDIVRGFASADGFIKLPAPGLAKITGLWAPNANELWAVGNEPTVYHWVRPTGWTGTDVGPDGAAAVVGRAANDVWMASELGHSVHWDGTAFTSGDIAVQGRSTDPRDARADLYFNRMGVLDDGTIWAAAESLGGWGAGWALSNGTWSSADAYTMAGASLAQHWASGVGGSAIFVSPIGPDDTNQTVFGEDLVLGGHADDLWAIAGRSARHGFADYWDPATSLFSEVGSAYAAPDGSVWITGFTPNRNAQAARWDGGTWWLFTLPTPVNPPIVASNGSDVWMANTSLWHWNGGPNGGALAELPYPTSKPFPAATGWYARHLFAVPGAVWILGTDTQGGSDALLRTDGQSWRFVPLPPNFPLGETGGGLRGTSDRDLWLVTGLEVLHYDGQAWSDPVLFPGSGQFGIWDIWPLAPDDVWAGPFHFDGTSWTATAPVDSLGDVRAMWADTDDDVWALTSTGLRRFDGTSWSGPVPIPTTGPGTSWGGLSARSANDLWLAGSPGIIHGTPPSPAPSP